MVQVGTLLKTQLAALEGRLFLAKPVRPPLAADRRRTAAASGIMAETPATTLVAPANPGSKRNRNGKESDTTRTGGVSSAAPCSDRVKRRLKCRGAQGQNEGGSSSKWKKSYAKDEREVDGFAAKQPKLRPPRRVRRP